MKVAVIGSRSLEIDHLEDYLPENASEIITGGAQGIDHCAREYALRNQLPLTEFLPEYQKYGRFAPLRRNQQIVDAADYLLAFWDGISHGTKYTIDDAKKKGVKVKIYLWKPYA